MGQLGVLRLATGEIATIGAGVNFCPILKLTTWWDFEVIFSTTRGDFEVTFSTTWWDFEVRFLTSWWGLWSLVTWLPGVGDVGTTLIFTGDTGFVFISTDLSLEIGVAVGVGVLVVGSVLIFDGDTGSNFISTGSCLKIEMASVVSWTPLTVASIVSRTPLGVASMVSSTSGASIFGFLARVPISSLFWRNFNSRLSLRDWASSSRPWFILDELFVHLTRVTPLRIPRMFAHVVDLLSPKSAGKMFEGELGSGFIDECFWEWGEITSGGIARAWS